MATHTLAELRHGGQEKTTKLKITEPLSTFPEEILSLGSTLIHLDLSGTGLSSLPNTFADSLPSLKIAFFSQCHFTTFPAVLARCPQLEMVAFRGNGMTSVPEDSLPPRLRWLILTDNLIQQLPRSIGQCIRLQKCMLAGNQLATLPEEMRQCTKLGLLRLSKNRFEALPEWLGNMPELAFLSFAGNNCAASVERDATGLPKVHWDQLELQEILGQGASGIISRARWQTSNGSGGREVAIKIFKGNLTSDGTPEDEMAACIAAGQQENIIDVLGQIVDHPEETSGTFKGGLVMQLIPPAYSTLGMPPSFGSCTRDCYPPDLKLSVRNGLGILQCIAAATAHLHSRRVTHGDLYAHNILTNEIGHGLLGDMGAATVHQTVVPDEFQKLEVLAFAHLLDDVLGLISDGDGVEEVMHDLRKLHARCSVPDVSDRPSFDAISSEISRLRKIMTDQRR